MEIQERYFYEKIKNWSFNNIKYKEETLTNWDMYEVLKQNSTPNSKILDIGTGG